MHRKTYHKYADGKCVRHNFKMFIFYLTLSVFFCLLGCFIYFVGNEWIIVRWPTYTNSYNNKTGSEIVKKKIRLFFWQHQRWNHETIDILSSNNNLQTIHYLVSALLTLLEEEQILEKKVSLQAVVSSISGNDLYISLDRIPFNDASSTFDKLMIIESMLKTLRENGATIPNIYFLVHHQVMQDVHIDFSHVWPLEGFLYEK